MARILIGLALALAAQAVSALTCSDIASLGASAAIWRDSGKPEPIAIGDVPAVISASLNPGEVVSQGEIDLAMRLVSMVYASRATAAQIKEAVLRSCRGVVA